MSTRTFASSARSLSLTNTLFVVVFFLEQNQMIAVIIPMKRIVVPGLIAQRINLNAPTDFASNMLGTLM